MSLVIFLCFIGISFCQTITYPKWYIIESFEDKGCKEEEFYSVCLYKILDNGIACDSDSSGVIYRNQDSFDYCNGDCPSNCVVSNENQSTLCDEFQTSRRYYFDDSYDLKGEVQKFTYYEGKSCGGFPVGVCANPLVGCDSSGIGCEVTNIYPHADSQYYGCQTGGTLDLDVEPSGIGIKRFHLSFIIIFVIFLAFF